MGADHHTTDHDDFGGLQRDGLNRDGLNRVDRRQALLVLGGAGIMGLLAACSPGTPDDSGASVTTRQPGTTAGGAGPAIAAETPGPFPADGTNGPNLLADGAVVRPNITSSIGDLTGTADGVPATVQLTIVDAVTGDPRPGAAVYLWHCTATGQYSIYEVRDQNYLRGVQVADDAGRLAFTTVFPGCYPGRWPHAHIEIYDSLSEADTGSNAVRTSQLALPQADCEAVYADTRYENSAGNLSRLSLNRDGVFADGWADQLATVSGSNDDGYTVSLLVRV